MHLRSKHLRPLMRRRRRCTSRRGPGVGARGERRAALRRALEQLVGMCVSDPSALVRAAAADALGGSGGLLDLAGGSAGALAALALVAAAERECGRATAGDGHVLQAACLSLARLGGLQGAQRQAPRVAVLAARAPDRYARGFALEALSAMSGAGCGEATRALVSQLRRERWCPLTSTASTCAPTRPPARPRHELVTRALLPSSSSRGPPVPSPRPAGTDAPSPAEHELVHDIMSMGQGGRTHNTRTWSYSSPLYCLLYSARKCARNGRLLAFLSFCVCAGSWCKRARPHPR